MSGLKYENKSKISELVNPINFFIWLLISFKDNFKSLKIFFNINNSKIFKKFLKDFKKQ